MVIFLKLLLLPVLFVRFSLSPVTARMTDLLGVNELHGGRCWSLPQVESLLWSHEVGAGRIGCCTRQLYPVAAASPLRLLMCPRIRE